MTPKPPSSSEGSSLPPRSRPNLGDLVKDSTELDLWSFGELDPVEEPPKKSSAKPTKAGIPVPRETGKKKSPEPPEREESLPVKAAGNNNSVRVNISKQVPKTRSGATPNQPKSESDFDDLDHWDETEHETAIPEVGPRLAPAPEPSMAVAAPVVEEIVDELPSPAVPAVDELDEFSPVVRENATPVSLVPHLGLTRIERIGLWSLLAVLLIGGGLIFFNTIHRLPTDTERVKADDFPVQGRHVAILSAETYWRAPINEGPKAETFRRGTQLLPVVSLTSSGGPAAVRLFFRNHEGTVMGDAVTRVIRPGVPLEVAATAGFEDVGMHAAYRTGQSKPWTIEVHEAPSESSPINEFKKLFEINISTDRR